MESTPTIYPKESGEGYDRRRFLSNAGRGLIAATMVNGIGIHASAAAEKVTTPLQDPMDETVPVKFPSIKDETEKQDAAVPSPMRPAKRVGYAIVGLGRLSLHQLLPAIEKCQYSKVVALVSGDAQKAKKVALQYGIPEKGIYNYENFDTIKDNPEIDAVYIVLPNSMHEEFTVRAAKAGKHVLCEKPMATSSEAAKRMIAACRKANKKLMIAYRIQYEPNHKQVKDWVREEKYGKVRVINSFNAQNIGDPSQWRLKKALSGGGPLPDIGIYNLNTIRYLLGEEPESVFATTYTTPGDPRFKEVEETMLFQLQFPSGVMANNTCSYGVHESRYYRCHADKGATFGAENAFSYGGIQLEVSEVKDKMEYKSKPSFGGEKDQFMLEIDHMSDCILNDKIPFTPGEEGLQDHIIMEALYESAKQGKVVRLKAPTAKDAFRGSAPKTE